MVYVTHTDGEQVPLSNVQFYSYASSGTEYNCYDSDGTAQSSTSVNYAENTIVETYYKYKSWTDDSGVSHWKTYNIYRHYLLTVENQGTARENVAAVTDLDNNKTWSFIGVKP